MLEQKLENVQRSIDELVMHLPSCQESVDLRTPKKKKASPALLGDDPAGYVSSSIKALKQEREYRVSSKLNAEEREMMYMKFMGHSTRRKTEETATACE
ncbi:hypothetical protein MTR67_041522 [Solanum verrucosum]|uniref:Uncharacterized protein n=1 Tax=Solanum verrucosum TaxID=315347 RepID=A0AAF0ZQD8_SOLVR|nr:hypothetical protein MTR67_041522 [Solanum verrucosum]